MFLICSPGSDLFDEVCYHFFQEVTGLVTKVLEGNGVIHLVADATVGYLHGFTFIPFKGERCRFHRINKCGQGSI